jgi:hypothetical protein
MYDNRAGRFLSVDKLTSQYPYYTPYQFAGNSPVLNIDLDGKEPIGNLVDMNAATRDSYYNLLGPKRGEEEYKIYRKGQLYGFVTGLGLVADYFLKGKITQTFLASQGAGLFEHNRANTPEGQAKQKERFREGAADLSMNMLGGIILGKTLLLFRGAKEEVVSYLFRGTSKGFAGNKSTALGGVTPTSSDPGVATIYAIEGKNYGEGVLHIALPEQFIGKEVAANVRKTLEQEIVAGVTPTEFANQSSITISADQARGILKKLGIKIPGRISAEETTRVLLETPKLSKEQINEFYSEASKLVNNGNK